jgi:NAD-dependent SIR2 family protein deacetylase
MNHTCSNCFWHEKVEGMTTMQVTEWTCLNCGAESLSEDFEYCPECQGPNVVPQCPECGSHTEEMSGVWTQDEWLDCYETTV